ncbi:MAG: NTP transferase domain-containing protein [Candidatus Thermoplasmatota archaeon]|nr:NTP transferase domain-containing protein [Candidatus Thermoplasmatota archaeon]
MQIVILCGGLATRLGGLAKDTPKSMIQIKDKPFLEYQIKNVKRHSITDIILCVGHLSEQIEDYFGNGEKLGVNICYSSDENKPLGPIGALKKTEPLLDDIFFTLYGDSYVFVDFKKIYTYFSKQNKLALMVVYQNFDKFDSSNIIINNKLVTKYGGEKTKETTYIDYGVSLFNKKTLKNIPTDTFYSTKDLFTNLTKQKELLSYEVKKRFYHIGTPESLKEFKKYVETKKP